MVADARQLELEATCNPHLAASVTSVRCSGVHIKKGAGLDAGRASSALLDAHKIKAPALKHLLEEFDFTVEFNAHDPSVCLVILLRIEGPDVR